jgi:CubicO group peptidase (beta-lactamase class C family)
MIGRAVFLLCCVVGAACGGSAGPDSEPPVEQLPADGATYWPTTDWRVARPAQVGLDEPRLDALVRRLRSNAIPSMHGLVIVRNGYLVVDEYFNGSSQADSHTMQSVTKSVTSLLTGIAVDQGKVRVADSLLPVFPQYTNLREVDDRKRRVTVRDLLTMRSGIDFYESPYPGSPLQILNESRDDWVRLVLDRPMNAPPDGLWQYNSGGVIVLAGVLRAATSQNPVVFAREHLFQPLGITSARWVVSPFDTLPHTGGGLYLRAQDLARIGYLVLRRGKWGDRQIVSERWLTESTAPVTLRPRTFGSHVLDYGYLWWLLPLDGAGPTRERDQVIYTASGSMSQWLFVLPKYDLVVAVTGGSNDSFVAPADFLYNDILRAIR